MVKLEVDTPSTVPTAPPAAGPDRAFEPPPAAPPEAGPDCALDPAPPNPPAKPLPCATGPVVAEGDIARPMDSPITAHRSAAATTHPPTLLDSNRHTLGQRCCLAMASAVDESAEDAGGSSGAEPAVP